MLGFMPGRWLVPLLLVLLTLCGSAVNYGVQVGGARERVVEQEARFLLERLSVEQARLDVQTGAGNALLVRRLVGGLGLHRGLDHALLITPEGRVQASLSRLDTGRRLDELSSPWATRLHGLLRQAQAQPALRITVDTLPNAPRLAAFTPIQDGRWLVTSVDMALPMAQQVAVARQEVLRNGLVVLAVATVLATLLHLLWFRRARQLSHTLADIGRGQLAARSGLQGRDELAQIGLEIDRMAEKLQSDQAEIRHLHTLVNRSPAVVIEWRNAPGWPVVFVNDAVAQWGYAKSDVLSGAWDYSQRIHPDDARRIHDEVAHYIAHGPDEYQQTYRFRCADGRWVWLDDRTTLTRNAQGMVTSIGGVLVDITAQKQAQEATKEQADLLRMFYEMPFIGMAISSPSSKSWLQVNDRLCDILGYPREQLLQKTWTEMTPEPDLQANLALFQALLAGERSSYQMEKRFVRADGQIVHAEIHVRPVYQADGSLKHLFTTVQDITERVQTEAALRDHKDRLEQRVNERTRQLSEANRELEAFSYTVSHDLRSPLRGIDGYSQLLQEAYAPRLDADGRMFIQRIRAGIEQMSQLISDLLDYSHLERRTMGHEHVDLVPLVERLLDGFSADLERHHTTVVRRLAPMRLDVDRDGLSLALRNLIGNAIKFSSESTQPTLEVGSRTENGHQTLWVRDNGVGFDMQYHDRIFGIFQRLHRAEDYPGTGVGLALVSKAAQRMGGRVWAESAPGAGATFYLEFPA